MNLRNQVSLFGVLLGAVCAACGGAPSDDEQTVDSETALGRCQSSGTTPITLSSATLSGGEVDGKNFKCQSKVFIREAFPSASSWRSIGVMKVFSNNIILDESPIRTPAGYHKMEMKVVTDGVDSNVLSVKTAACAATRYTSSGVYEAKNYVDTCGDAYSAPGTSANHSVYNVVVTPIQDTVKLSWQSDAAEFDVYVDGQYRGHTRDRTFSVNLLTPSCFAHRFEVAAFDSTPMGPMRAGSPGTQIATILPKPPTAPSVIAIQKVRTYYATSTYSIAWSTLPRSDLPVRFYDDSGKQIMGTFFNGSSTFDVPTANVAAVGGVRLTAVDMCRQESAFSNRVPLPQ